MRENNRRKKNTKESTEGKKWLSITGFLFSVTLLTIAIFLSINQEEVDKLATSKEYTMSNMTLTASSEISKSINEVTENNVTDNGPKLIGGANENTINTSVTESNKEETNKIEEVKEESGSQSEEVEENKTTESTETKQFIMPVNGEIYKEFSMDSLVYSDTLQEWVTHRGVDIQVNISDEIKAVAEGTIKSVKNDPRYGWSITIAHNDGFETVYACLVDASLVQEGDKVEQGQVIAKAGNSGVFEVADGSHLHFEMLKDGAYINPEMYIR